jgi:hypothetical protein
MHTTLDKAKLLDLMKAEYAFAARTLALVKPEQMKVGGVCGHWSIKDLIAHLTAWEQRLLKWVENGHKGISLVIPEIGYTWQQIDMLNEQRARIDSVRLLPHLLEAMPKAQAQVLAMVEALPEEDIFTETAFNKLFQYRLLEAIAANTYEHYAEHLDQIRVWLSKQR